jgi:hypothetical protein
MGYGLWAMGYGLESPGFIPERGKMNPHFFNQNKI